MSYPRVLPNKSVRIGAYTVFAITIVYVIVSCLALLFQCHPIAKLWDMSMPGHCVLIPQWLASGISNVAIDIMVLLVPVPGLMKWEVSTRMKVLAGGAFVVGSL